jgi:hypothetical protein
MEIVQNGETPAMIVILANGSVIFVQIRRAEPFMRTPEELGAENRESLTLLRSLGTGAEIVLELWVYSKHGSLRFFRVEASWLLEIGRDGRPLTARETGPDRERI